MFNTAAKKGKALILMLPSPVVADELQVIPQRWSGTDPVMFIEVLGCEPWHHDSFLARDVMSEEFQPTSIIFHRDHAFIEVEFWFLGSFWDSIKQLCVLVKAGEKQPLALRSTSSFLEKNPHPMLNSTCTHGDVQRLWQVKMVERIFLWENKVENSCSYGQTTSKICRTSQDRRNQERQSGKSWVQHTGKGYCSPWGRPVSRHGQ